ncbi:MAG: hypothetical protein ACRDGV_02515 [Candidatus Limnocylindria bacterium]
MGPWAVWVPLLALINLFIFVALRGRWGRGVPILAIASVAGVLIGDQIAARTGLELLRVGDMHVIGASVTAQALMVAVSLLAAMGPIEVRD